MISKIVTIAIIIAIVLLVLKLLKVGARAISFAIWLGVVSVLIYLSLPWLDPYMQKVAKVVPGNASCYGLILESGDCFGIIN